MGALLLGAPTVASAQVVPGSDGTKAPSFSGPCVVEGRILETGAAVDPASSGGVYEIPSSGTFSYRASLGSPVDRPMDGEVYLLVPPPVDEIRLFWWNERDRDTVEQGTYNYRISNVVSPMGLELALRAIHVDEEVTCEAVVHARVAGAFWDGLLRPTVALATVLAFAGMVICGRRRRDERDVDRLGVRVGF